jgi:CDP-diacylglycerol--glycerol-3-phosphate 3-phosphatidyltransferase
MTAREEEPTPSAIAGHAGGGEKALNLPNVLSAIRLLGSFVLLGLTLAGGGRLVLPLIVVMLVSDWLDGKLAILLNQRTTFGAKLDSVADVSFYAAVLVAACWLKGDLLADELIWVIPAVAMYGVSSVLGWYKFGRIPTYHTRGAKTAWLLVTLAILALFTRDWAWPVRVVSAWVFLVNLEAILITSVLPAPQVDVASLLHAWRIRQRLYQAA